MSFSNLSIPVIPLKAPLKAISLVFITYVSFKIIFNSLSAKARTAAAVGAVGAVGTGGTEEPSPEPEGATGGTEELSPEAAAEGSVGTVGEPRGLDTAELVPLLRPRMSRTLTLVTKLLKDLIDEDDDLRR
jgi:hypothetical protein